MRDEIAQRVTGWIGFGGAGVFTGITVAEFEIWVRVVVGVLAAVGMALNIYVTVRKLKAKNDD